MNEAHAEKLLQTQSVQLDDTFASLAITLVCMAMGLYACSLNHTLYTHKAPFYDSLAYNQAMAETMAQSANGGIVTALRGSMNGTTVYFPSIVAALIGPFASPQRDFGVWIQTGELLVLSLSLYFFMRRVFFGTVMLSASLVLPILSLKCYYQLNGGLSDFRMDLSLMLMFGVTSIWYLIASFTERTGHFVLLGIFAGIAILFRATAPVYLIFALGPCVLLDILNSRQRLRFISRLALSALVATFVGGWFLIVNYKYLHYYYVVWNIDAQARLPLKQASKHIEFVADHIGNKLFLILGLLMVVSLCFRCFVPAKVCVNNSLKCLSIGSMTLKQLCMIWMAISPVTMLVFKGAGLNPFVSMPSSLGIVLVVVICLGQLLAGRTSRKIELLFFVPLALLMLLQTHSALSVHAPGTSNPMNGHKRVIQAIVADARFRNLKVVRFSVSYCGEMTAMSLRNVMTFDLKSGGTELKLGEHDFVTDFSLSRYAPADWDTVPGETMDAKISSLATSSTVTADYLILPEPETVEFLSSKMAHVVCNKYASEIRAQLLKTEVWAPISEVVELGPDEKIRVFKNSSKQ